MTVVASIPSQTYTPRTINSPFAIPSGTKRVVATMTRESWPSGAVGGISVNFPDGTLAAAVTFDGGVQLNFDGSTTLKSGIAISVQTIGGVVQDLPAGTYTAAANITQTLTTAVLVERF